MIDDTVPITVLTGFLGAGKTNLLNRFAQVIWHENTDIPIVKQRAKLSNTN